MVKTSAIKTKITCSTMEKKSKESSINKKLALTVNNARDH